MIETILNYLGAGIVLIIAGIIGTRFLKISVWGKKMKDYTGTVNV